MQLPDFIRKMLGFTERVEKHFTAAEELEAARKERDLASARVSTLEKELADLRASSTDGEVKITGLNTELASARSELKTKSDEVAKLAEDLKAANAKANTTIAAQGLPADQLPSNSADTSAGMPGENAWAKYLRLSAEDPRAAGDFYVRNAEEILKAKSKKA